MTSFPQGFNLSFMFRLEKHSSSSKYFLRSIWRNANPNIIHLKIVPVKSFIIITEVRSGTNVVS